MTPEEYRRGKYIWTDGDVEVEPDEPEPSNGEARSPDAGPAEESP